MCLSDVEQQQVSHQVHVGKISDCHIIEVEPCCRGPSVLQGHGEGWWGSDSSWSQEPGQGDLIWA